MPFTSDLPAAADAIARVTDAICNTPRSLQKRIGPSEIGQPCDHCLAAKLAGWDKTPDTQIPWASTVGTACHEYMAGIFERLEASEPGRWLVEQTVTIGRIGGTPITGSCDLFDTHTGTVLDWKFLGDASLRASRPNPKQQYRVQIHAYGRGMAAAGHAVHHVCLLHLPRTKATLQEAFIWHQPYDELVALNGLARADRIARTITAIDTDRGTAARDAYISALDRADGCFDCRRYHDFTGDTRDGYRRRPTLDTFFTQKG